MQARTVRFLLMAVVLPAAIVAIDECAFRYGMKTNWPTISLAVIYPLLVGQVAVLGFVVGRADQPAILRWTIYAWVLVLVNLTLFSVVLSQTDYWYSRGHVLGYALLSGQIGLIVIWVTLSSVSWAWRLPGGLIVTGVFACLVFRIAFGGGRWQAHVWPTILLSQSLASLALCILLRWYGVRIQSASTSQSTPSSAQPTQPIQFSVRHLLAWTAAINVFLLLVRGLDFLIFTRLHVVELFPAMAIGAGLALGSLFAMWSSLGSGHLLVRVGALLATGVAGGYAMQILGWAWAAWLGLPNQWSYRLLRLANSLGDLWTVWYLLAVCFLAALLVVFRSSGYCLVARGPLAGVEEGPQDELAVRPAKE